MPQNLISHVLSLVGAVLGAAIGFYTFLWLLKQGYYGLIIPGAFLGLGCSLASRHRSMVRGLLCGVAALGLSQFADWYCTITDDGFLEFLSHGKTLTPVTMVMTGIATLVAFWIGSDASFLGFWKPRLEASREPRRPE